VEAAKGQAVSKDNIEVNFVKIFPSILNRFATCQLSESSKVSKSVREITGVNEGTIVKGGDQM
jgi:hypothetical protein